MRNLIFSLVCFVTLASASVAKADLYPSKYYTGQPSNPTCEHLFAPLPMAVPSVSGVTPVMIRSVFLLGIDFRSQLQLDTLEWAESFMKKRWAEGKPLSVAEREALVDSRLRAAGFKPSEVRILADNGATVSLKSRSLSELLPAGSTVVTNVDRVVVRGHITTRQLESVDAHDGLFEAVGLTSLRKPNEEITVGNVRSVELLTYQVQQKYAKEPLILAYQSRLRNWGRAYVSQAVVVLREPNAVHIFRLARDGKLLHRQTHYVEPTVVRVVYQDELYMDGRTRITPVLEILSPGRRPEHWSL